MAQDSLWPSLIPQSREETAFATIGIELFPLTSFFFVRAKHTVYASMERILIESVVPSYSG